GLDNRPTARAGPRRDTPADVTRPLPGAGQPLPHLLPEVGLVMTLVREPLLVRKFENRRSPRVAPPVAYSTGRPRYSSAAARRLASRSWASAISLMAMRASSAVLPVTALVGTPPNL